MAACRKPAPSGTGISLLQPPAEIAADHRREDEPRGEHHGEGNPDKEGAKQQDGRDHSQNAESERRQHYGKRSRAYESGTIEAAPVHGDPYPRLVAFSPPVISLRGNDLRLRAEPLTPRRRSLVRHLSPAICDPHAYVWSMGADCNCGAIARRFRPGAEAKRGEFGRGQFPFLAG